MIEQDRLDHVPVLFCQFILSLIKGLDVLFSFRSFGIFDCLLDGASFAPACVVFATETDTRFFATHFNFLSNVLFLWVFTTAVYL